MFRRKALPLAMLAAAALPAGAQETRQEFRPEIDFYIQQGERMRIQFRGALQQAVNESFSNGTFLGAVEFALRPLFRRELRHQQDVFRRRYVTFRAGYQYRTSSPENRAIGELTARYPLPGAIVLVDRNRGDFRFVKGQAYSSRYRNRLWVERDFKLRRVLTPYLFAEVFYDTRFDAWTTRRFALGLQAPVGSKLVVEPYLMRQENSRSTPRRTEAVGLKFNLYF
jgi:hypothetical protein